MYKVTILYTVLIPHLIFAQVGIPSNSSKICDCHPPCTAIEDVDCKHGQIAVREDCPCCQVCARQEGERCGDLNSPCDRRLGLVCSHTGICEAMGKCKTDSDCPQDRFCAKDTRLCTDPCLVFQPCLGFLTNGLCVTRNHAPLCECPNGMLAVHEVNACLPIEDSFSSSPVTAPPPLGCTVEGVVKAIGDSFYTRDCGQKCVCGGDGVVSCYPMTCPDGLFPIGSFKGNKFCREIFDGQFSDRCCVLVECSSNFLQAVHFASNEHYFSPSVEKKTTVPDATQTKLSETNAQTISEQDSSLPFGNLKEMLNSGIAHNIDHLQNQHLFKHHQSTHAPFIPLLSEMTGVKEDIPATERATLTTFLLQNLNEENSQTIEEITPLIPTTTKSSKTLPESSISGSIARSTTTPLSEMETNSPAEVERKSLPKGTNHTVSKMMEKDGLITEVENDSKVLHNITIAKKDMKKDENPSEDLGNQTEIKITENAADQKMINEIKNQVDGMSIDIQTNANEPDQKGAMAFFKLTMDSKSNESSPHNEIMKTKSEKELLDKNAPNPPNSTIKTHETVIKNEEKSSQNDKKMEVKQNLAQSEVLLSQDPAGEIEKLSFVKQAPELIRSTGVERDNKSLIFYTSTESSKAITSHTAALEISSQNNNETIIEAMPKPEDKMKTENSKSLFHNMTTESETPMIQAENEFKVIPSTNVDKEMMAELKINSTHEDNIIANITTHMMTSQNDLKPNSAAEKNDIADETHKEGTMKKMDTGTKLISRSSSKLINESEKIGELFHNISTIGEQNIPEKKAIFPSVAETDPRRGPLNESLGYLDLFKEDNHTNSFREGNETNKDIGDSKPTITSEKELKSYHDRLRQKTRMFHVKGSTHNSTTLALPSSSGGVLHYKESKSDIEAMKQTVAEGLGEVTVNGLSPNTRYTFKWAGTGTTSSTGKIEAKTEDGCRHNGVSYAVGGKWHEGCKTTCNCHPGGVSECHSRCFFVAGDIKDDQCVENPSPSDPECCVEYNCEKKDNSVLDSPQAMPKPNVNSEAEPKLIVTARSHNSIAVAWDDFRADNPDRRYVTEYREVPSLNITSEIPWMKKETARGQPPPTMTIGNLKPNTLYEIRVGIYSQAEERNLIAATETKSVATEAGCVYGNTSFAVGEFFQGCEERCTCANDGSVRCSGRCTIPYFRKGSFADDPLCFEEQEEGDECCVLVMCAHGGSKVGGEYDQCANTVCGKNAECVAWPTLTEATDQLPQPGSCICKQGFSGDPTDHLVGCTPNATVLGIGKSCMVRGTSYKSGDVFYEGCSYKCTCNNQGEIECQPRCQYNADETPEETQGNNSCSYQTDPTDECCKIRICNFTSDGVQSPALGFDGCTYRNKTYAKNEEFTFGCDSKCLCLGFGDVTCYRRCPPVKEKSEKEGVKCETLLDPEDECCDVTVCDDAAPDVLKANLTRESSMDKMENDTASMTLMENKTETTIISKSLDGVMNETPMNETEMESNFSHDESNTTAVNAMEFDMKNNSSLEGDDMSNATFEKEMMVDDMKKSSNEMEIMNKTEATTLFMNDTSMTPRNDTDEEKMNVTKNFIIFSTNEAIYNETEEETTIISIEPMDDEMEKTISSDFVVNETETTTISVDSMNEQIVHDQTTTANDASVLRKKARFDDSVLPLIEIIGIEPIDSSTVKITVKTTFDIVASLLSSASEFLTLSYSPDSLIWRNKTIPVSQIEVQNQNELIFHATDFETNDAFQFKVFYRNVGSPIEKASLVMSSDITNEAVVPLEVKCQFKGKTYSAGETFYDECIQYCQCTDEMKVHCEKIQCPERFGLEILDPGCIEWDSDSNYTAVPPRCCGKTLKCMLHVDDLSCEHMGHVFKHYDMIPQELVGCDQQCHCFNGSLNCESLCGPVSATPPFHLPCLSHEATIVTDSSFPCCRTWQCLSGTISDFGHEHLPGYPPDFHTSLSTPPEPELTLVETKPLTSSSVLIVFTIDDSFVGLPGGISLRYISEDETRHDDLVWKTELIHEKGVIMDRSEWKYIKSDLRPGTKYIMQLALSTHLKKEETVSERFMVTTLIEVTTPLPRLDLNAELSASEIKNTSAKISWKRFTEFELQYIDGIRVRFWPGNKKFPLEGPMLHREADSMILRNLIPDTKYTVDLFFIPHEGLTSTISNTENITFTTLPKPKDKYAFNITIQAEKLVPEGIHIQYSGIPEPEGKYVNVYRVVYTTDGDSWDSQKFKLPKNQKEAFITLTDLKPGVQYEVWLEAYLTNGGKKKSNVITVQREPDELPTPEKSEVVEPRMKSGGDEGGSYYSAFVAVVILVALACLVILALLFLMVRRQNHAKAHINSPKANSAYDNPSYKTSENQNYGMELNGLKNTTNGAARNEEP